MKLGAENKKKAITAATLLVLAVLVLYRGLSTPMAASHVGKPAGVAGPLSAPAKTRAGSDQHHFASLLEPTLDPHLRLDLLAGSEGIKYQGSGRDIFEEHSGDDIPKPVAPAVLVKKVEPPPPPPPPPINLKFWGWASPPGEPKAVFLAQGENAFVAHEGDIVARRYKVLKINPNSVDIEDLLSSNRQSIPVAF